MSSEASVCSACGNAVPADARYCARCGHQLDGGEPEVDRRVYGVLAPGPLLVLTGIFLVGAVLALLAGSVGAAVFLFVLAVVACIFLLEAAKRVPEAPLARRLTKIRSDVRGWAVFARESSSAWFGAGRDVARLKNERRSLRREREFAIRSLGDAAYRGDAPAMETLRVRLREIDDGLAERERAEAATVEAARRQVSEEHAAARPTEQYTVEELTGDEPEP